MKQLVLIPLFVILLLSHNTNEQKKMKDETICIKDVNCTVITFRNNGSDKLECLNIPDYKNFTNYTSTIINSTTIIYIYCPNVDDKMEEEMKKEKKEDRIGCYFDSNEDCFQRKAFGNDSKCCKRTKKNTTIEWYDCIEINKYDFDRFNQYTKGYYNDNNFTQNTSYIECDGSFIKIRLNLNYLSIMTLIILIILNLNDF